MFRTRIEEQLLALAGAVGWDGGDGVVGVLRTLLEGQAAFEAGEVTVASPAGFRRWTLTEDESPLVGEELLMHLAARPFPLRIDDLHELEAYPRTLELMQRQAMRSLLVLPLSAAGGAEGAIAVAARHGWAFAGTPLRRLAPLAAMAGLALAQSRLLASLRRLAEGARADSPPPSREVQPTQSDRRLGEAQLELHHLRATLTSEREELAELQARVARLVEERDGALLDLAELRQAAQAREVLLQPASDDVLRSGRRRRR